MKWLNDLDVNTLGTDAAKAYETYKAEYRKVAALKATFEDKARKALADEHGCDPATVAFSYRFGKLSLGIGEARVRKPASTMRQSLAAWVAQNA